MTKHTPSTALVPVKIGRPTSYRPELLHIVAALRKLGATRQDVADALEVGIATVDRWAVRHSSFREALNAGAIADRSVERSLLQRALGYNYTRQHVIKFGLNAGEIITTEEHVPADPTSCFFWLQNRDPERWRNVQHREHRHMVMHILPEDQDA